VLRAPKSFSISYFEIVTEHYVYDIPSGCCCKFILPPRRKFYVNCRLFAEDRKFDYFYILTWKNNLFLVALELLGFSESELVCKSLLSLVCMDEGGILILKLPSFLPSAVSIMVVFQPSGISRDSFVRNVC
jgi:hypothetical protein